MIGARRFIMPLVVSILAMPMSVAAAASNGDEFVTRMDGNTLSATAGNGMAYNLYFLSGGQITYRSVSGKRTEGTWHLDDKGRVCIEWPHPVDALEGCFHMSIDGDTVTWRGEKSVGRATLRGNVADTFLKSASIVHIESLSSGAARMPRSNDYLSDRSTSSYRA